ncbi:MAG: protein BatD [Elusimicrobia bacterium]|nr:protein BatD [Elusimicrobiota bacterium]
MKRNLLLLCLLFVTAKTNAEININASVDKNTVNFGDSIVLRVVVSGDVANIPKPELPVLTDFNVYSSGTSQNISFVNGQVSSSVTYNFILSPNKPGKFTIGAVNLTVAGKKYATTPINIEVLPSGSSSPQKQVNVLKPDISAENREIFITASLDKKRVFVNEAITYTFRFFTTRNLYSNPEYHPPNFTGFVVEDLPPQKSYQTIINGKRYNVIEIKTALFATSPGNYNLGAASLLASVRDFTNDPFGNFFDDDFFKGFFGVGKTVSVKSKPLDVEVLPLLSENKPANFLGAVGSYDIKSSADKSEVEANSPITLTVTISGEGNIKSILEPRFPNIIGVRKYDTISTINISKSNYKVSGSKTFKTVIVPLNPGYLIIPEFEFSYFNPAEKEYKRIKSNSIKIKVKPSTGSTSAKLPVTFSGINILEQDIRFIKMNIGKKSDNRTIFLVSDIIFVISILIFLASFSYNRYNYFVSKNHSLIKSRRAFKEFEKSVNKLLINCVKGEEFYGGIYESVIKYISDKTKTAVSGYTFSEMENILLKKNLDTENIKEIKEILENANFMRFAPSVKQSIDLKTEATKIKETVRNIERRWKI